MDDILHKYTAGELLKWFEDEDLDLYITQEIIETNNESVVVDKLDIEAVKVAFLRNVRRYELVKRGKKIYIHDNKECQDIMTFQYDDSNYEYVQNTANNMVESLNNRDVRFIGKKHYCG